jgi:hypothetical protein
VQASTNDAFRHQHGPQIINISVILLHELHIEAGAKIARRSTLGVKIAAGIRQPFFAGRKGRPLRNYVRGGLEHPEGSIPTFSICPPLPSQPSNEKAKNCKPPLVGLTEANGVVQMTHSRIVSRSMEISPSA